MSPNQFPLVVFSATNYAKEKQNRLIDGPASPRVGDDGPEEMDDPAEDCLQDRGDRRCFLGIRRLVDADESRMVRLLDGVPNQVDVPRHQPHGGAQRMDPHTTINKSMDEPSVVPSKIPEKIYDGRVRVAGNMWEALLIALVLGGLSLWFGLRKMSSNLKQEKGPLELRFDTPAELPMELPVAEAKPTSPTVDAVSTPAVPTPVGNGKDSGSGTVDSVGEDGEEDSDGEGEGENDVAATPGKRKQRRKRGKKKKLAIVAPAQEQVPAVKENGGANAESSPRLEIKGLDLSPPSSSLILASTPKPVSAPSLVVSETILGELILLKTWIR